MADICGSIARSFGSNRRVGQLSMIAGAIAEPSMSESDWVAKMTDAFFFRSVFSHSRSWPHSRPTQHLLRTHQSLGRRADR